MIDTLIKELDTEMTEAEVNEKNAQEEYEEMMADSSLLGSRLQVACPEGRRKGRHREGPRGCGGREDINRQGVDGHYRVHWPAPWRVRLAHQVLRCAQGGAHR